MSFLSSAMLWALPLAAIPLVIHLMNRRRRHVLRWAAMQFLVTAATRQQRWKIHEYLLLCVRTAAVLALVLALARPLVRSSWFGTSNPRDVIVVLDVSMSTGQTAAEGSGQGQLFGRLVGEVGQIIDELGTNDTCRILLASAEPTWVVGDPVWASADYRATLKQRLENLEPTLGGADWLHCLRAAVNAPAADSKASRMITVVTDGQAGGWHCDGLGAWRDLKNSLLAEEKTVALNVYAPSASKEPASNLVVESVSVARSIVAVGETASFSAVVRNVGAAATVPTVASWSSGSNVIENSVVPAIEPGQTASTQIEWAPHRLGAHDVVCSVAASDRLLLDNSNGAVIEAVSGLPVLIVDGTLRKDPVWTDTGYLATALGRTDDEEDEGWRSPFRAQVISTRDLTTAELGRYCCVVLANVSVLPEQAIPRLETFVRDGGGLYVLLGDQTSPALFAAQFKAGPESLVPFALGEPVEAGKPEMAEHVRVTARPHPATRLLDDADHLDLDKVRVRRWYRLVVEGKPSKVCVLMSNDKGEPIAVEAGCGRGRVVVQAFPLNPSWSNLPACQSFVVWVHEWLWYLSEPSRTRRNLGAGEPIELITFGESGAVSLKPPWGDAVPVQERKRQEQTMLRYERTALPGLYEFVGDWPEPAKRELFRVARDPAESDLTCLSDANQQQLTAELGLRFVGDPRDTVAVSPVASPFEPAWSFLLTLLVCLLFFESIIAGGLGRRRASAAVIPGMQAS